MKVNTTKIQNLLQLRIATLLNSRRNEMPKGSKAFWLLNLNRKFAHTHSLLHAHTHNRKSHPPFHETEASYSVGSTDGRNPEVQEERRLVPERGRGTRGSGQGHLVKAATTAHSTSLVPAFRHSASGSKSRSCRTRLVATSYCSSSRGANAFSRTSEAWAR